jgi:hypothetical protein
MQLREVRDAALISADRLAVDQEVRDRDAARGMHDPGVQSKPRRVRTRSPSQAQGVRSLAVTLFSG